MPEPTPGLVIRYAFLWSDEARRGAEEAAKDRPCAIVVAMRRTAGDLDVIVAPVTHAPPTENDSVEIPIIVARKLGLDAGPHWIRIDELNRFAWPGYDLRALPGRPGEYAYGMLPETLYKSLRLAILERQRRLQPRVQSR
ncbi:MAG TPA: hypothetical protein VG166_12325 [Caulobacteraceae bacterium]|nr:hypothetical protein [Caulobacteraceae bacterium]